MPAQAGDEKSSEYFTRAARRFLQQGGETQEDATKELFVVLLLKPTGYSTVRVWKTIATCVKLNTERKPQKTTGQTVKISNFLKRLIYGDNATDGSAANMRNIIVWAFIALVALFLTNPSGEQVSFFDKPIPLPAELGLGQ
ncbi:hypothetical protein [Massilia sp. 9I]|uniref:hypothetical protein n=1 Tax=Massilia sp. 9I TaxID=2653152 RepID=UPI0012F01E3E|nr:hypothetical protein [Massilia sp. 9I]VXB44977.1 hypothetical protein MASSI9I_20772 [Massilia sp. 9I]